ncbi:TPA: DUF1073 domain-containing protein [Morganella morganii]|nr:DUF1073 domain-containing protein [Morganella morganii subsp. morganii]RRN91343.1 DUF1073 domain-containing protein [Morganella morganii]HEC0029658.1 DUF1073 domain-containing protein [Morganella morganii]HEC0421203.1 DUF1073 domain-containing protein [Morganella morganii]
MRATMEVNRDRLSLAVNNAISAVARARMTYATGGIGTGNTKRPRIWREFGYPEVLTFNDFYNAYDRNALGGAAVDRYISGCWIDVPEIFEGDEEADQDGSTDWDNKLNKLLKSHWEQIKEADKRNLVGRYSGLIIQLRDGRKWDEPVDRAVVSRLKDKAIIRMIPAWEEQLDVKRWNEDQLSEDYGYPALYSFTELHVGKESDGSPGRIIDIHPDRVIILAEGAADGKLTSGTPLLRKGYNKLIDAEKVSGGSAEGFLKNASRQLNYAFSKETDFQRLAEALGTNMDGLADALDEQVRRLNESIDASVMMQEGTASVLSVAPADPEPTWRTALAEFAASINMPVKVLIGQITGERASTEDMKDWAKTCMSRRTGFLKSVIESVVSRFWSLGVIEPREEITVSWSDLLAPSKAEKIDSMNKAADIAVKTQQAFGHSVFQENEIRALGEYPTLTEFENTEPPETGPKGDPLTDDKEPENRVADNTGK